MEVRAATADDLASIIEVHARAMRAAGRAPESFYEALEAPGREALWLPRLPFVLVADGGFAWRGPAADVPDAGELYLICVDPDRWGTGVGDALITVTADRMRANGRRTAVLWTAEANARARRFYERNGWRPDGAAEVHHHTGAPTPSLRYRLDL